MEGWKFAILIRIERVHRLIFPKKIGFRNLPEVALS
jgi:hypothetical protein